MKLTVELVHKILSHEKVQYNKDYLVDYKCDANWYQFYFKHIECKKGKQNFTHEIHFRPSYIDELLHKFKRENFIETTLK